MPRKSGKEHKRHKRKTQKAQKEFFLCCLLCFPFCVTMLQLLVFWTEFSGQHIPLLAEEGCPRHPKTMDPFRFVADGVVSSARLRRPAELTTITASRYRARASRPSAPVLWLRGIFLMTQPPLLCEEGNMTHSSSVQTATSSAFGCGVAALCLLWFVPFYCAETPVSGFIRRSDSQAREQ